MNWMPLKYMYVQYYYESTYFCNAVTAAVRSYLYFPNLRKSRVLLYSSDGLDRQICGTLHLQAFSQRGCHKA